MGQEVWARRRGQEGATISHPLSKTVLPAYQHSPGRTQEQRDQESGFIFMNAVSLMQEAGYPDTDTCGNTLVLTVTQQNAPMPETFWATLRKKAENSGEELRTVTLEFIERLDLRITRGGRSHPPDS